MNYEEFQHLARLYIVGVLEDDEMDQFRAGRAEFGAQAEAFICECRKLNSVFALSLRPMEPSPAIKAKLMEWVRDNPRPAANIPHSPIDAKPDKLREALAFEQKYAARH